MTQGSSSKNDLVVFQKSFSGTESCTIANYTYNATNNRVVQAILTTSPELENEDCNIFVRTAYWSFPLQKYTDGTWKSFPLKVKPSLSLEIVFTPKKVKSETYMANGSLRCVDAITGIGQNFEKTIIVDHNYGGLDRLTYVTPSAQPIEDAEIVIYNKDNYEKGLRTARYVLARTSTDGSGKWRSAVLLEPGDYSVVFLKRNEFGPDVVTVTVSEPNSPTAE